MILAQNWPKNGKKIFHRDSAPLPSPLTEGQVPSFKYFIVRD